MMKFGLTIKAAVAGSAIMLSGCDYIGDLAGGHGYVAKNVCSGTFVANIEEHTLQNNYVAPAVSPLSLMWNIEIDHANNRVVASDIFFNNIFAQEAYYRPGFGCTLLQDSTPEQLDAQLPTIAEHQPLPADEYWPFGTAGANPNARDDIDYGTIESAIDEAFAEPDKGMLQTVAVVVAYDNELITERYARSITPETRLTGWSMTKSVTSTLIGLMQDRDLININDRAPVDNWLGTEKEPITIENLLHMSSGLEYYEESRGPNADQNIMLHRTSNFAEYFINLPLINEPGTVYNYSTGETNLLAAIAQDTLGGSIGDHYHFIHENLFQPIGITDPILEYDTSGNFAGGAYSMLKPRDWARLGLLYERNGDWFGEQVLSEYWIDYATTPSPANPEYGAQIRLNTDSVLLPSLPEDTFIFTGFLGQYVVIVPSKDLVVVRMGFSFDTEPLAVVEELVATIIDALPQN